jgi:hypothetical protein
MKRVLMAGALFILFHAASSTGQEQFIELMRSDLRADKVAILTASMELSDEESMTFWPIYREYELELAKLGDRRLAILREYGKSYETMTDENAKRLVNAWFKLQEDHTKLAKKYNGRFEKALSSTTAARFVQVEHQIQLLVEISMASEVPLVKRAK